MVINAIKYFHGPILDTMPEFYFGDFAVSIVEKYIHVFKCGPWQVDCFRLEAY